MPGAKSVYAIRIKAETDVVLNAVQEDRLGGMAIAPPCKWSLAKIYTRNIEKMIDDKWKDYTRRGLFAEGVTKKENATKRIAAAIKVLTRSTVSHEVLHGLNLNHCENLNCIMTALEGGMEHNFDRKGNYYQIKMVENPNQDPDDPDDDYIYARDPKKGVSVLRVPYLNQEHWEHLAVTGGGAPGTVSKGPTVTIGFYDDDDDDDQSAAPTTPTVTLVSSDGIYTATAGDSHTANLSASEALYSATWYIAGPGETGRGTHIESDGGDGTATTASLTYTFPSGVSGDYTITALAYKMSDMSLMGEVSYTVTVSLPVSVPVWSDIPDPYNLTTGDSFSLDLSSYVTGSPTITRNGGVLPAGLSLSNGVLSGTVTTVENRGIRFTATNTAGSANSEWIEISIVAPTPVVAPVWSDIPDPYNLTVGDSFSLDLSSYVTGSPTITRNSGSIPTGLSISGSVISGTVTRSETRSIQFTATNSAGTAYSEWIQISVAPEGS